MKTNFACLLFLVVSTAFSQNTIEYYNKANVQSQYQNYEEAIRLLTRALAVKPDYADAYALRGDCYYYLKDYTKAIADYLQDSKYKKGRSSYNLACTFALTGKKEEAFQALEANLTSEYRITPSHMSVDPDLESLRNDPRWDQVTKKNWYSEYETALNKSDDRMAANDLVGAIDLANSAIRMDPANAKGYGKRALLFLRSGDLQKCLQDLNAAIQADPASVYFGNRAYTHNKLGNKEAALADYERAVQLDPTNLLYYDLAIARYTAGDKAGAMDAIVKHTDYFTMDEMGYYFAGIIASETERFTDAINFFNKAIGINATIPQLFMKRADAYFLMKNYSDAITDYSKVIELDPSNAEAYYIRGNAKASQMDKAGACSDWRKAGELGFTDSNGYIRDICN